MKLHSKLLAILIALLLSVSAFGAFTVSAAEEEYQYTQEDIEMYASLLGMSYEETLDYLGITAEDLVESSTVSSSDAAVSHSYSDMLSSVEFTKRTTDAYGITYKLPKEAVIYGIDSDEVEMYNYLGASKVDVMNSYNVVEIAEYTDTLTNAVVYYQISAQENTPYGKAIENYGNLSVAAQNSLIDLKLTEGYDESNTYTVRRNGNLYLIARTDTDYMSTDGICTTEVDITTVINGIYYNTYLYIQHGGTEADADMVNSLISSFSIKGIMTTAQSNQIIAIVALCLCGILLIVIGFLVFFIIRFSLFSKASGSKFNIIGFDIPKQSAAHAVSKHSFRSGSDLKDSLESDDID